MRSIYHLLPLLFYYTGPVLAQSTETSVVVIPASTVMIATTVTSTNADLTVTVTPTGPSSPQYTSQTDLIDSVLNSTNFYRWEHNATFLDWNASLASYASNWAQQCMWEHSHGGPGENLARGYPDVISSIDAWGDERSLYNFNTPTGFTEATGHFTQLVWKSTQTVGCSAVNCDGRNGLDGWFLVCEYWPQGNIVGLGKSVNTYFKANVQNQVNNGQGFNGASAIAGASGVGTRWATSAALPTATSTGNTAAKGSQVFEWEVGLVSWMIALFGVLGL